MKGEKAMKEYLPASSTIKSSRIEADSTTLMRQAQMTADTYLAQAIIDIDDRLGAGYAKKNPTLIAAYMQTSAIDLGTAVIARAIQQLGDAIEDGIARNREESSNDEV
jgi:hypothetical protein